ncbi:MAG: hypothetical protein ABSH56_33280 [Bryobacteraceae bacterium]|jgi:3-isopropylmalate dehydratase small subunit
MENWRDRVSVNPAICHVSFPVSIEGASETSQIEAVGNALSVPAFSKHCLMESVDELGYILNRAGAIDEYEKSHPAPIR